MDSWRTDYIRGAPDLADIAVKQWQHGEISQSDIERAKVAAPHVQWVWDVLHRIDPSLITCPRPKLSRGRPATKNVIRDVRICMAVEDLKADGRSFRAAIREVGEAVGLSAKAVESIVRKERLRGVSE